MNRTDWKQYIEETWQVSAEHPWEKHPGHMVFRHRGNRKWFALILNVRRSALGLDGEGTMDLLNVKADPPLIGSLLLQPGYFPAYHMNKENWISVALDGSVPEDEIKMLLDMSHELTAPGRKRRGNRGY